MGLYSIGRMLVIAFILLVGSMFLSGIKGSKSSLTKLTNGSRYFTGSHTIRNPKAARYSTTRLTSGTSVLSNFYI